MASEGKAKAKTKTRELTVKQSKLVQGVASGKTKQQAALDAGYGNGINAASASVQASETLNKPNVQAALQAALIKHGINPDRTIQRVSEALDAEKVAIVGNGEQAMAEITPDHTTRLQAVKIANTLMGLGQKQETNNTIIFNKGDVVSNKYVQED